MRFRYRNRVDLFGIHFHYLCSTYWAEPSATITIFSSMVKNILETFRYIALCKCGDHVISTKVRKDRRYNCNCIWSTSMYICEAHNFRHVTYTSWGLSVWPIRGVRVWQLSFTILIWNYMTAMWLSVLYRSFFIVFIPIVYHTRT